MSDYDNGYDEGYRAGMQKMREVGQARIEELEAKLANMAHAVWAEHKHFEAERKYALRQVVKWMIAQAETDKCSAFDSPSRPRENRPPGRFSGSVLD
jgi:hypothetical protein